MVMSGMSIVLRFLRNEGNAPTAEAKTALRNYTNFEPPSKDVIDKTVLIIHDELLFMLIKIRKLSGEKRVYGIEAKVAGQWDYGIGFYRREEWLLSGNMSLLTLDLNNRGMLTLNCFKKVIFFLLESTLNCSSSWLGNNRHRSAW